MSGFTPGPWVTQRNGGGWVVVPADRPDFKICRIENAITFVMEFDEAAEPDACLIAASPELLKQLERAEFLISNMANARLGPLSDGAQARLPEIRAAIAKARGES